jgi:hypothetical protein
MPIITAHFLYIVRSVFCLSLQAPGSNNSTHIRKDQAGSFQSSLYANCLFIIIHIITLLTMLYVLFLFRTQCHIMRTRTVIEC